jgi:predicted amino acid dehydrogenase
MTATSSTFVPSPGSPPQLDLESIFKDVLTRADVSQEVGATILGLARTWEIIFEARVQSVHTTNESTRIEVVSPYIYQGRTQDAEFWFPRNPKHFEAELRRVQLTGQPVEVQFFRAPRAEDHEITSVRVYDNSIKFLGS